MKITLVAAVARDRAIGKGGDLPWRLPGDLRRFRRLTVGHAVVMGRKTWDSLPKRPLAKRLNIVLSRDPERCADGARVVPGVQAALRVARDAGEAELFVIGGSS
ncbi:MAG TPA: dihydrofolate reductase, partial [Polyangiaceae bacterium]|nr:dihydrofolate reductase [Polyangiaceae bacterium]